MRMLTNLQFRFRMSVYKKFNILVQVICFGIQCLFVDHIWPLPFCCIYFFQAIFNVSLLLKLILLVAFWFVVILCTFSIRLTSFSNERMPYLSLSLRIIVTFKVFLRLFLIVMVMMLFDGFVFFYRHRYWQRHFLYDGFGVYVCVMFHGHMYANPIERK